MKTSASLVLALLLTALLNIATAQEHVEVDAKWKNSAAEEIAAQLHPLSREAELAVVDDGKATIYFNSGPLEVAKILLKLEGQLPKELLIVRIEQVPGEIPNEPKQSGQRKMTVSISREKSILLGIKVNTISDYVQSLKGETTDSKWAESVNHGFITTPDGKRVPLNQLLTISMIDVKRPLIFKKKSSPAKRYWRRR